MYKEEITGSPISKEKGAPKQARTSSPKSAASKLSFGLDLRLKHLVAE